MSVLAFPTTPESVDALWERHRSLAAAIIENPKLLTDRAHMEAAATAERAFKAAFDATQPRKEPANGR